MGEWPPNLSALTIYSFSQASLPHLLLALSLIVSWCMVVMFFLNFSIVCIPEGVE